MHHPLTSKGRLVNPPLFYIHVLPILTLPKDSCMHRSLDYYQSPSALVISGLLASKLPSCKVFGYIESARVKVQRDVDLLPEHKCCQMISHATLEVFYTAQ